MKKDEKSVAELAKAYADAEKKIRAAASRKNGTVKEYKATLTETVMLAVSILAVKNKTFAEKEIPAAFTEGQNISTDRAPETHMKMSAKAAGDILKNAGFRYGTNGHDTYIELHNAVQTAGKDFLSRVNAAIGKLSEEGKNTVYSVSQAVKEDIEKQGLLNVEYKGGRKVSIAAYAAMAARSARIESANIGAFGRALENGTDYVKCTEIYPTCEICAKYQGKIYCISGKDKRFPALFETALRHGYALMHPNCRHEFIPVWLETMSDAELAEAIEKSKISPKADTRSEEERNAYAAWQAKQRQIYHERLYFEQAKQRLGKAMPYESIAAFRRSYRTAEDTFAHKRSHNLIKDFNEHNELKAVLQGDNLPKTLAEFQDLKYNNYEKYSELKIAKENEKIRSNLGTEEFPLKIQSDKQGKHIRGYRTYIEGKSYLAVSTSEEGFVLSQNIVSEYHGKGVFQRDSKNEWKHTEVVVCDRIIGFVLNKDGRWQETDRVTIHYAKNGTHIVPTLKGK